jgi:hypothetical protein
VRHHATAAAATFLKGNVCPAQGDSSAIEENAHSLASPSVSKYLRKYPWFDLFTFGQLHQQIIINETVY